MTSNDLDRPAYEQAEAGRTHYIEEAVRVYLMRDLGGNDVWVIDPASFGEPLCSDHEDGPANPECRCERPDECESVVDRMREVVLPCGEELTHMLASALGYTVSKKQTPCANTRQIDTPTERKTLMTTNLPDFATARTVTDLAALNATHAAERPHLAQSPINRNRTPHVH